MRRSILATAVVAGLAATLSACGGTTTPTTSAAPGGSASAAPTDGPVVRDANADLVIWSDDKRAAALQSATEAFAKKQGIKIAVQAVSKDLQTNFITANQAGNGPDVVLGAHDWIGNMVQNSAISPVQIPSAAVAKLSPIAVKAMQFNGQSYGAPYAVETIGLFRNNKLTTVEPKSIEELVTAAKASGAENPLCLPVGQEGDAYHMQPLFTSGGGYLFAMSADGSYDPKDMGVGKPGSVEAATKIAALAKDGVLKTSIDGKNNISLFTEGKCAYMVSGPWALSDAKKANIDFTLSAIPGFEGAQPAKAFTGAQAMFVASKAKNKTVAEAFINEALTSEEIQTALYKVDPRPPALVELNAKLAAEDANTAKFGELAEKGDPMPNIKEMAAIWAPLGKAQSTVVSGDAEPEAAMKSAGDAIAKAIAG
ncbi:MAG: maltose ABC transporter substrate-binding protein [Propionibacteriaceae bacterium]|nr:maltose ABC transporter substrate-binding protein [Propionibacteriaceae bacterium]